MDGDILSGLNPEQRRVAAHTEGAVMVSAGAGSGKTRALTRRIAYIVLEKGVSPRNILAITFTNKAAREMSSRIDALLSERGFSAADMWVMTFHAMCARMLRMNIDLLGGYDRNFSIYDEDESGRAIKGILKDSGYEKDDVLLKKVKYHIGNRKNRALTAGDYASQISYLPEAKVIVETMNRYEEVLKKNNALDFDDLLFKTYELLTTRESVLDFWQNKFRYIHVDEFQDTNELQYLIARMLAEKHGNIMAVGDEDQSIYGWRGARFSNMGDFARDFNAAVYKLEQNYRSTKQILDAANSVIKNNTSRVEKKLWTDKRGGAAVTYAEPGDDRAEADYVVRRVRALRDTGTPYGETAVLMRVNALSRVFEERFLAYGIPYRVFGGFRFYERKEIKDALAYVRAAVNPSDDEAVLRAAGAVNRGIGAATLGALQKYASENGLGLNAALLGMNAAPGVLPAAAVKKLAPFRDVLRACAERAATLPLGDAMSEIIRVSGLPDVYSADGDGNEERRMNIDELRASAREFASENPDAGLAEYLQSVSLMTDLDGGGDDAGRVTIATVHSAKGLEFDAVFVVGLEEGLFPSRRSVDDPAALEEERRLLYVAITRARDSLCLTNAASRFMYGARTPAIPSRFLSEIEGIDAPERPGARTDGGYGRGRGFADDYGYSYRAGGYNSRGERAPNAYDEFKRGAFAAKPFAATPFAATPSAVKKAADLQAREYSHFKEGDRVRHTAFGNGVIVGIGGALAEIKFDNFGRKTLSLAFAPLTREEDGTAV